MLFEQILFQEIVDLQVKLLVRFSARRCAKKQRERKEIVIPLTATFCYESQLKMVPTSKLKLTANISFRILHTAAIKDVSEFF